MKSSVLLKFQRTYNLFLQLSWSNVTEASFVVNEASFAVKTLCHEISTFWEIMRDEELIELKFIEMNKLINDNTINKQDWNIVFINEICCFILKLKYLKFSSSCQDLNLIIYKICFKLNTFHTFHVILMNIKNKINDE